MRKSVILTSTIQITEYNKQRNMKNKIILFAAGLAMFSCQKKETTETVIENTTVEETAPDVVTKQCYMAVTAIKEGTKTVNDSIMLNIETKGDSITGTFKWLPYYKDKKTGEFKGTVKNNIANTILSAKAEGTTNLEEFIIVFDATHASIKMGEMAEGTDGIWHYKDKAATSENSIPKVECK